jgi:hypothetical protein
MPFGNGTTTVPRSRFATGFGRRLRRPFFAGLLTVLLLQLAVFSPDATAYPSRVQVFVANSGSDDVTVYDTRLGQVVGARPVWRWRPSGLDGRRWGWGRVRTATGST